ncbi:MULTISPECIES: helix-turn-helix transcriptional regulator [Symbiopectobacterium]|uniref:helix-turn-helix transcriptional regulator n=1 Tax=Symbiopectobacterium TaxID=801 RepID=UPI001A19B6E7|nr:MULTISPECIES: helix-turn-helix transcriptional regulator [Symbiopectobacterium]MBG6248768.1 XRE family transcriptional regulator [Candidatus Symbiopectobacterium sp. PLON1]MBT9428712.1 helix-turn-helix domain-containing protein [Candidatus Symbiopectobacterium endolongispinus]
MSNGSLSGPKALGAFLRAQREMLAPERVGLPIAGRRRTSGLRREELAQLSRISTTWYTCIEQGREVSVSPAALSRLAQALFRGWLGEDPQPNLLRFMFVHPLAKQLVVDWPERARHVVAEFRAESSHYSHELMRELVMQLCRDSREFERWWTQQAVMAREGGERRFHHATTGQEITYQQQTFHPALHQEFKLVMSIPADTGDGPTPR